MKSSARVTGVATKAARFGLAVVLAACSGQPGAIPVATGPVVQTAASHSSSMPVSVDALPVIVSTSTHTVPLKKIEWPKLPAASAGKAFAHPQVINLLVLDASGKRIVGTYATPIELTDADTSGATHLLINGKPASAKNVLTASTSVVTLSYTGLAIPPVSFTAKAKSVSSKTAFAPKLNKLVYSGSTSAGAPSIALTSQATSASFSVTEDGWTNAPYDRALRVVPDASCASFATVSSTSGTSFKVKAVSAPANGTCNVEIVDFTGGNTLGVAVSFTQTLGPVTLFVTTGNTGNGVYRVPPNCTTASCVAPVGGAFLQPYGVALDASGTVWVADQAGGGTSPIYKMAPSCTSASCVTALGSVTGPAAIALDASGNAFVGAGSSLTSNGALYEVPAGCTSTGCIQTLVSGFEEPTGVALDPSGDVFISDIGGSYELPEGSTCSTVSCLENIYVQGGNGANATGVAVANGTLYLIFAYPVGLVLKEKLSCVSTSSDCFTQVGGQFLNPGGVAVDASGNVYIADPNADLLYGVPPGCSSTSCTINITPGNAFTHVYGIAVQSAGPAARRR